MFLSNEKNNSFIYNEKFSYENYSIYEISIPNNYEEILIMKLGREKPHYVGGWMVILSAFMIAFVLPI